MPTPAAGLRSLDDDAGSRPPRRRGSGDSMPDLGRHVAIDAGVERVGSRDHHGAAGIGAFAQLLVERDLAEKRHAELLGLLASPAMAEDLVAGAAGRAE